MRMVPFRSGLPSPVAVGNHAHARFGIEQAGLNWILPWVDPGGPKTRHNGLPVTALKKRLKGVGRIQGVQDFGMRNRLRWHSSLRTEERQITNCRDVRRREKRNQCEALWLRSHRRAHKMPSTARTRCPHTVIWTMAAQRLPLESPQQASG